MKETIHRSLKLRRSRTEVEEDSSSSCSVNYSVRSLGFSNLYSYVLTRKRNAINVESTRFKNQARMNSRNPHNI
ncbi:hypothetical protein HanRHA438_Chr09g0410301 [Helianthus annuus]|uniref:Uncharacterized protein n=1 Tax=Helianthus annuus TaxID=4232 RepID=A0A251TX47_HELAN|nr:hypothetical protein HanXRQr2_Chr09g0398581 [Helianthus annuus]KAJ0889199.1 hypothetical protein HanRHA438_Chr09g0410301 [Helianthus annuus]KAJ0894017.1 hypothetical protein HanPSC8_Chr09g0384341 [Helianthus annuus]